MSRPSSPLAVSLFASALVLFLAPGLHAQRGGGMNAPGAVALSPDGSMLAWTLRSREGTTLHLNTVDPSGKPPDAGKERLIAPNGTTNCSNTAPVWSRDSQTLAFTSTCTGKEEQPGQEQLFLWARATGDIRQLTHLKGNLQQAAWSPDGKAIAFLFVQNATRSAGALDAMKPWAGVIGEDNIEIQRVYGVRVATGKGDWLTPADLHTYEFSWAPKSQDITFIAAPPPGENTWWVAKLYTKQLGPKSSDCLGGGECAYNGPLEGSPLVALDPSTVPGPLHGLQIAVPRYSPDGTRIAFIGGLMSDQGSTGGDVWYVAVEKNNRRFSQPCTAAGCGNPPINATPGINGTPVWEGWFDDHSLGFVEDRSGHTVFQAWDVNKKTPAAPETDLGEASVSGGPIKDAVTFSGKTDTAAFVLSGIGHSPDIWLETGGKLVQYSHMNDGVKSTTRTESVEWTNEGFHVQGWITYPAGYDPAKKYPLIVTVHGGPSASSGPMGGGMWAQQGYFEFRPNPRGSFGQGEAFTAANRKDFGYGDLRDILAGMDMLEKKLPIDKTREGLTGWSYGGFMSMFAATQTTRFRAIVAGAGISDWLSYYGENSIDQWMLPFFGASVYEDPAVYAKSSAISYIKNVKTPMLIIVGDRDGECPAPQSFEMWHALRDLGVKTQLVVYPNEGHGFRDPAHIRDRNERTVKWFAENMPASGGR